MRLSELELHARRLLELATRLAEIEKRSLGKSKHSGEEGCRKLLDARVVFLHRIVEEAPGCRELILDVGKVALQLLEVRVGLQVRVVFRKREQLPQRPTKHIL